MATNMSLISTGSMPTYLRPDGLLKKAATSRSSLWREALRVELRGAVDHLVDLLVEFRPHGGEHEIEVGNHIGPRARHRKGDLLEILRNDQPERRGDAGIDEDGARQRQLRRRGDEGRDGGDGRRHGGGRGGAGPLLAGIGGGRQNERGETDRRAKDYFGLSPRKRIFQRVVRSSRPSVSTPARPRRRRPSRGR